MLLPGEVLQPLGPHALGERPLLIHGRRGGVKQAHEASDLWRDASYNSIPAAIAAFNDSTPTVGIESSRAAVRNSGLTPRASLPISSAQGRVRSVSCSLPA